MSGERFTVGSVSGYSGDGGNSRKWATIWYVHDSANCAHVVKTFHQLTAEKAARSYADLLNDGYSREHVCRNCDETFEPRLITSRRPWHWSEWCSDVCRGATSSLGRGRVAGRLA